MAQSKRISKENETKNYSLAFTHGFHLKGLTAMRHATVLNRRNSTWL